MYYVYITLVKLSNCETTWLIKPKISTTQTSTENFVHCVAHLHDSLESCVFGL